MSILSRVAGPFVIPNVNYGDMQTAPPGATPGQAGFLTAKVIDFISDPKTLSEAKKDLTQVWIKYTTGFAVNQAITYQKMLITHILIA